MPSVKNGSLHINQGFERKGQLRYGCEWILNMGIPGFPLTAHNHTFWNRKIHYQSHFTSLHLENCYMLQPLTSVVCLPSLLLITIHSLRRKYKWTYREIPQPTEWYEMFREVPDGGPVTCDTLLICRTDELQWDKMTDAQMSCSGTKWRIHRWAAVGQNDGCTDELQWNKMTDAQMSCSGTKWRMHAMLKPSRCEVVLNGSNLPGIGHSFCVWLLNEFTYLRGNGLKHFFLLEKFVVRGWWPR